MKLILRTTALLAFAHAISLQTEIATYESRISAAEHASLLAVANLGIETWLFRGLGTVANYTQEAEGASGHEESPLKVKNEDLYDLGTAYGHFSMFLDGLDVEGITFDAAGVNKLIRAFESSLVRLGNAEL